MRISSSLVALLVMIAGSTASAAIIPVGPFDPSSAVAADVVAGTGGDFDGAQYTGPEPFSETVTAGIANLFGTASATASQTSDIDNPFGGVSVTGGTATASTGAGSSTALSSFTYNFRVTDEPLPVRLAAAIAQTGTGDVRAYLRD